MVDIFRKKKLKEEFYSFTSGRIVSLEKVPDPVFAERMMGDGYAIEPSEGKIYSPVEGYITAIFPTGHAIGIKTKSGIEVLIHIGIDTVELKGKLFKVRVCKNDKVNQGDLLVEFDLEQIKQAKKSTIIPMIFTSENKIRLLKENEIVTNNDKEIFEFI